MTLTPEKTFCLVFVDWHDGGDGTGPSQSGQCDEWGDAFIIDQFKKQLQNCTVGQYPVMIGRRKRAYNTLDKVMQRLDLIHNVMSAMNFIVVDIHWD